MLSEKIREWLGGQAKVEPTGDLRHGDYTTNLAMVLKRDARELVAELEKTKPPEIARIEVAGPGFINFYLTSEYLQQNLVSIKNDYGHGVALAGQKLMVEYTDPNPFKEFHLGHLMSNAIGETIARLLESQGAEVIRACYQGDVGLHVAKAIWGALKLKDQNPNFKWAGVYAAGAQAYESDEAAKAEITEINKKIYDRSDASINELYDKGRAWSLAEFEKIYQKLGTKFDTHFFESEMVAPGLKLVREFLSRGVFEESEGAVVFKGEKFDPKLHTRVYITAQGLPTYETKELGLHFAKAKKYSPDLSIVITANEQDAVFKVGLEAFKQIDEKLAAKIKHLSHGVLRLPSGKMSSRTGEVITAGAIISQLAAAAGERNAELDRSAREEIAVAALKYQILKQAPGRDVIFDQAKALSLEGDSGPYLQYTAVRAKAVLAKVQNSNAQVQAGEVKAESYLEVVRRLVYFPELVARAAAELAPQLLVSYLTNLAAAFNHFYATERIIGGEYEVQYLELTKALAQTLINGLNLLGIAVPERM
jgi:arginyl-tRNA synthetase